MIYTCASCTIHACVSGDKEKMPANCPMRNTELMERAKAEYLTEANKDFYVNSCLVESEGYCQWPRVREIVEFAKKNGYHKLGVAFCTGLRNEGRIACDIFRRHGFEVVSVICKAGSMPKETVGITEEQKVRPGTYEVMCNPVAQAMLLNEQKTELNVVIGLCVGHDSLFYQYSDALCTTLVTKDRALAHNPAGALYGADSYFTNRVETAQYSVPCR